MGITDHITGLQHIGIPTTDLEKTIAYYKALGFELEGKFPNGASTCVFLKFANLTLEVWTVDSTPNTTGAINHFALNTTNIEKAFEAAKELNLNFVEGSIQNISTFWKKGIAYFNVLGPNGETIEFCQIL